MKSSNLFLLFVLVWACSSGPKKESALKGRQLVVEDTVFVAQTGGSVLHRLPVAIADEETERNSGLMDVFSVAPAAGMLFVFENEEPLTFWMANTPLSLDMIFINAAYEVVKIHVDTQPYSNTTYSSEVPAKFVLELPAGGSERLGIREGMLITRRAP